MLKPRSLHDVVPSVGHGESFLGGLEPTISAGERPQTYALDRAATGTGGMQYIIDIICVVTIINSCIIFKITVFWDVYMRFSPVKAEAARTF